MPSITSQSNIVHGCGISQQGGRPENQDDWGGANTPLGFLIVVCDGMGGGPGGKTASHIAKTVIIDCLMRCSPQASPSESMKKAIAQANDVMEQQMSMTPRLVGMGSTMVAVLITSYSAVIAHLGDSRCYRISHGRMVFRTKDHSLVGELVENKAMTEEQARTSPQSNIIKRALGATQNHIPQIEEQPFLKGDRFILCTDGIWGVMPHDQLLQWFTAPQSLDSMVEKLSEEVDRIGLTKGNNHDNHTLVVIETNADSTLKETMSKTSKITIVVMAIILVISLAMNLTSMNKSEERTRIEELERVIAEQQEKLSSLSMSTGIKDSNTKDLIVQVEQLKYEIDLLEEAMAKHINTIDSLEKVIAKLKPTTPNSQPSAKESAQKILNLLGQLMDAKGKDVNDAIKKKTDLRHNIQEELIVFDRRTESKYSSTIEGIKRVLKDERIITVMEVKLKNGKIEFTTTNGARKDIEKLVTKIEKIKKEL